MRYSTRPFASKDFYTLVPQARQATDLANILGSETWTPESIVGQTHATSAFRDDTLLGFGVVTPLWRGRASVSIFISVTVNRYDLIWAMRLFRAKLDEIMRLWKQPDERRFWRIECSVLEEFDAAHRMARMLGFVSEGLMKRYDPAGRDHRLYARVR